MAPCKLALQLPDVNWDGVGSRLGHGDVAVVPARISGGVFFNGGNKWPMAVKIPLGPCEGSRCKLQVRTVCL